MLIKSLMIENFRQFKGINRIDFSCNKNKNVSVILGNNTFGKTTLLQAFSWCLYGKANLDNPDKLLNLELENTMNTMARENVVVEIVILHGQKEYTINRKQSYKATVAGNVIPDGSSNLTVLYKDNNGETIIINGEAKINSIVNEILPEDLSSYFFFDTERIGTISNQGDIKKAIKGLLGLAVFESALKHIGSKGYKSTVLGKLNSSYDFKSNDQTTQARNRLAVRENEQNEIREKLDLLEQQLNKYNEEIEKLENILKANAETATLQKNKEDLENRIKKLEEDRNKNIENYFKKFGRDAFKLFIKPLLVRAEENLKDLEIEDVGIKDLTKTTIDDLLNRGKCICGCELCKGNDGYENLLRLLQYVPPESISSTVKIYLEKLKSFSCDTNQIIEELDNIYENIDNMQSDIEENEEKKELISEKLKNKENMRQYEINLSDAKKQVKKLSNDKINYNRSLAGIESEIKQDRKTLDSFINVSRNNKIVNIQIQYVEALKEMFRKRLEKKEDGLREQLEEKVNYIFSRMYSGRRRVYIDDSYKVTLFSNVEGKELDSGLSEGALRVKNFAFIAGLVALAKEKLQNDEDGQALGLEPYPLVMDAPFSNTDEKHTENISKVLPEVAEQVIMFVMHKDWDFARRVLENRIGMIYELEKHSETYTTLRKEAEL